MALYIYTADHNGATFNLANGQTIDIKWVDLSDEIKFHLMMHGLKQKVADAAAIPRDTETGRSAADADKIAAMQAVATRLVAGEWSAVREGGGGGNAGGLLLRALMQLQPHKSREELAVWLKGKSKSEQAALRTSPKIAPIIDELRAAKTSDIDADDMLADLGI